MENVMPTPDKHTSNNQSNKGPQMADQDKPQVDIEEATKAGIAVVNATIAELEQLREDIKVLRNKQSRLDLINTPLIRTAIIEIHKAEKEYGKALNKYQPTTASKMDIERASNWMLLCTSNLLYLLRGTGLLPEIEEMKP